jgi:hypothetical protein
VAVAIQQQFWAVAHQTERTVLLGTILIGVAVSGAIGFVLIQYYSVDVTSSLVAEPADCGPESSMRTGVHCFSDYPVTEITAMRPNPWEPIWQPLGIGGSAYQPLRIEYPAAEMVPHLLLGSLGKWFDAPQLGLVISLAALTVAAFAPAFWAARGARGLERIVVFVTCGAAAVPAWVAIDRGNLVGLLAPIALVFLVALCGRRWGLVAIGAILAALVKPQYAILVVVLFAARRWRLGGATVAGVVFTNVAAYLLWPRDFPGTIGQSIHNLFGYTWWGPISGWRNVSFANGLYWSARKAIKVVTGHGIPEGYINPAESLVGYAILVVVVGSVLVLGRRIDPIMAGIALLATASLSPPLSWSYYLVFALPVAAVVARDPAGPPGSGIFDRLAALGDHRRAVGICVTLAAAFSIAQIALPGPKSTVSNTTMTVVPTTGLLAPLVWLMACAVIVVSYARRPVPGHVASTQGMEETVPPDGAAASTASVNL